MNAREVLYPSFPRNVGNPKQFPVYNWEQLNRFIVLNSGLNDECYASTCSYQNNRAIFEDLFLEMDSLELAPIIKVANWFTDHGIYWIPLFSGNRGIHIHALFSPEQVHAQTINKFANLIIKETHTEGKFDEKVSGDLRRLARIPNTKRLNKKWCIPLSREDILNNISAPEILQRALTPQFVEYNPTKRPKITEFIKDEIPTYLNSSQPTILTKSKALFKDVLRPCIFEKIQYANPRDDIRITATVEALRHGIPIIKLVDFYESLNWVDFDRSYTQYQIEKLNNRVMLGNIRPFGKQRLGCTLKRRCIQCKLTREMK